MKNKKFIVSIVLLTSFVFFNTSFAQTAAPAPNPAGQASSATKLKKGEAEVEALISKFQNFINRLQQNADKLNEIIRDQKAQNIDVTVSTAKLSAAQAKIADAQKNLDSLATSLRKLVGAAKGTKKTFSSIKTKSMKTQITKNKDAHKALIEAMQAIKKTDFPADNKTQSASSTSVKR